MNFKTTYILFGVLIGLLLIFGVTQFVGLRKPSDTVYVLPSLNDRKSPVKAADIDSVEISRARPKEEKLVFYRTDAGWQLKQPSVRVEGYLVDRLIDQVIGARVEEKKDVAEDLKSTGLDTPAAVVTLTRKNDQKEFRLNLGNESPGTETAVVYATSSDRKQPVAIKRTTVDMVSKSVNDYRSKTLLEASSLNSQALTLQEGGREAVALEKGSEGKWRFLKPAFGDAEYEAPSTGTPPPAFGQPRPINSVKDLLEALGQIRVEDTSDFVAEDVSDSDLAQKYGLDAAKPALLRIEVKRNAGGLLGGDEKKPPVTEVLLIGKKVEAGKDDKKDGDKDAKCYARLESDRAVVKVPAKNIDPLVKISQAPEVLRNRDLLQIETAKVDAIDIRNPGGQLRLRHASASEPWKLFTATSATRTADNRAVQELLTLLTSKRQIRSFPEASKSDADLGLDKPVAEISLWVDGVKPEEKPEEKKEEKKDAKPEEKKDEKKADKPAEKKDAKPEEKKKDADAEPKLKSDKPTVRLAFGKKEGDIVYVLRQAGDDKTRVAVPDTVLTRTLEGPLAYLDRSLPLFPAESEPAKLTLVRGAETYEIDREQKDEKSTPSWKIKQPKNLADRLADGFVVENIIANLRSLQTEKLMAEKASEADLDRFGLKSPAFKATVALKLKDGKMEERAFLFGKETDDKASRYAKLGERDFVFLVRANTVQPLQGELLDPTILNFELDKVRGLKLTGWQHLQGVPFTLDLERKSPSSWVVKAPAGFQLNETVAETFVGSLRGLRATKFVAQKTGTKPEHKLEVKEGALEIEIALDGEKDPVKLTIGGLSTADKAYYATTSRLPGDVFVLPEDRFKKVLEGAIYFRKAEAPK